MDKPSYISKTCLRGLCFLAWIPYVQCTFLMAMSCGWQLANLYDFEHFLARVPTLKTGIFSSHFQSIIKHCSQVDDYSEFTEHFVMIIQLKNYSAWLCGNDLDYLSASFHKTWINISCAMCFWKMHLQTFYLLYSNVIYWNFILEAYLMLISWCNNWCEGSNRKGLHQKITGFFFFFWSWKHTFMLFKNLFCKNHQIPCYSWRARFC